MDIGTAVCLAMLWSTQVMTSSSCFVDYACCHWLLILRTNLVGFYAVVASFCGFLLLRW